MNRHFLNRMITLMAMLGLAGASLLLLFLLLDRSMVGATSAGAGPIPYIQAQGDTFTVSGTVTCQATGPISNVEVFAWNRDKGSGFTGDFTDSSGTYSVALETGNYDLSFHPPCDSGCASQSLKGIAGSSGLTLTLNIVLPPGHTVSGTVFATDGHTPVGNVFIYAYHRETADGFGLPPTKTDGHYCIGLVEGPYDLSFTPPACLGLSPTTEVITVTQDTIRNVTLPSGFTVAGCVTDEAANPVPGVQVYAYDPTPGIGGFGFAPTNETGCYTGTLPTGTFDFQFIPPPGLGLGSVTITNVVSATAGCPNTSLPVTLPHGFTVSGRATCNGKPVKNVFVYADPVGPPAPGDDLDGWGVYTVDNGSYGLALMSDTYTLWFTPPPATGLNAKAFTTVALVTDTVLNADFCLCSGVWVSETVDSAGDVGGETSLALEPNYPYTPHISYRNIISDQNHTLKHAWLSGDTWLNETVDSGGKSTSLALAPIYPYTPCISYSDWWGWDFKYACRQDTTWTITTVVGSIRSTPGRNSLAMEPTYPYTPHISFYNTWGTLKNLGHAYLSGTAWCSGTWVTDQVEPALSETGQHSSLALESTYPYTPHISYRAGATTTLDLKHAWKSGTTWLSETVDSAGDVGWHTSLALDSNGNPHISYFDNTEYALRYAWLSGTIWLTETVDSARDAGWYTSLALDNSGNPHISYYYATNGDLKFARFNGTVWIIQTVDSGGDVGQYSSLALDQVGCPCISYYDATKGDLKYACLPPIKIYLPIITKSYP